MEAVVNALTNTQRQAIRTWLDTDGAITDRLDLPNETPLSDATGPSARGVTFSVLVLRRQKVAYRTGWWQYYAEGEGDEPLVFGRMRREPVEPFIRLSVREKARHMQGDLFSPEEAQYLKNAISSRTSKL